MVGSWDGGTNEDIYGGKADDSWLTNWAWVLTSFDLIRLLPGKPVRIGFQYKGLDGAQISLAHVQKICSNRALVDTAA